MPRIVIFMICAALAGCASPLDRLAMMPVTSEMKLSPLVSSAMVRTVSLPTYAAVDEIAFELPGGLIASNADVLWADDPQRAVTLVLTRNLSNILNTELGPEPWPFVSLPDVAIDVRVERMLAGADGVFHLTGQFYVGGDGIEFPNSTDSFDISVAMPSQSLASIARAQAAALLSLSEKIAQTLGR